jgi:hypothetical protein
MIQVDQRSSRSRILVLRKVLTIAFWLIAASPIALGIGIYVYPANPWIAWGLLFLCWVCYRLHLRAQALFGPRQRGGERASQSRARSNNTPAP